MHPHVQLAIVELISIMRAHVANCTLIEQESVRSRNLVRLANLEAEVRDENYRGRPIRDG